MIFKDIIWSVVHRVEILFGKTVKKVVIAQIFCSALFNWTHLLWNSFRFDTELVDILAAFKYQRWDTIEGRTHFNFLPIIMVLFFNWFCNFNPTNVSTVVKSLFDPFYLFEIHRILKEFLEFFITAQIGWTFRISLRLVLKGFQKTLCKYFRVYCILTSDLIEQFDFKFFKTFSQSLLKNFVNLSNRFFGQFFFNSHKFFDFLTF